MRGLFFGERNTVRQWRMENGKWRMKVQILRICPIEHNCTLHTTPVPKGSRPGALPEGAVSRRLTEGVKGAVWPKARLRESLHLYIKPRRTPQGREAPPARHHISLRYQPGDTKTAPATRGSRHSCSLFPVPSSPCSLFPRLSPPHSSRIIKNSDVINSYPRAILSGKMT